MPFTFAIVERNVPGFSRHQFAFADQVVLLPSWMVHLLKLDLLSEEELAKIRAGCKQVPYKLFFDKCVEKKHEAERKGAAAVLNALQSRIQQGKT
jgi:hypothetical protein